jgi:hypothetical protein
MRSAVRRRQWTRNNATRGCDELWPDFLRRNPTSLFRTHNLWKDEEERGQTEGRKDRPCAIVLAVDDPDPKADGRKQVAVAPTAHSLPRDPSVAVEIPLAFITSGPT